MAKLWAGRFQKETDLVVNDFNSSVSFDSRMYREDIEGSIAHATMLGKQGIIEESEAEKIVAGLKSILADIEAGKVEFSPALYEDIHMASVCTLQEAETIRLRWICVCTSRKRSRRSSSES